MPRGSDGRDIEEPLLEHEPTDGNRSKKRSTLLTVCPYILGQQTDLLPHAAWSMVSYSALHSAYVSSVGEPDAHMCFRQPSC